MRWEWVGVEGKRGSVSDKLQVGDRVYVRDRRAGLRTDVYQPGTVMSVARVYCRVKLDKEPYAMSQRFDAVTGAGEWPSDKGGLCPYFLLRPERYEKIIAAIAAAEVAKAAAEEHATERLRAMGIEMLPNRAARITATTLLAALGHHGVRD